MNDTFPAQVWKTLSALDVSGMVEKKGRLNYLSWANCWTSLMNVYPDSRFAFLDDVRLSQGTVEVHVSVTVADGEHELTRVMTLPVMNHKNVAIVDPDSRDISDNRMRCLVKCIALFGLGLFLYRGEDIPQQRENATQKKSDWLATEEQQAQINEYIGAGHISERRRAWIQFKQGDKFTNWERMTEKQAGVILTECKEMEQTK